MILFQPYTENIQHVNELYIRSSTPICQWGGGGGRGELDYDSPIGPSTLNDYRKFSKSTMQNCYEGLSKHFSSPLWRFPMGAQATIKIFDGRLCENFLSPIGTLTHIETNTPVT